MLIVLEVWMFSDQKKQLFVVNHFLLNPFFWDFEKEMLFQLEVVRKDYLILPIAFLYLPKMLIALLCLLIEPLGLHRILPAFQQVFYIPRLRLMFEQPVRTLQKN